MASTSGWDGAPPEALGGPKDELYGEPVTFLGRCTACLHLAKVLERKHFPSLRLYCCVFQCRFERIYVQLYHNRVILLVPCFAPHRRPCRKFVALMLS